MKDQSFESALKRLEEIVKSLEGGEMPLGKSLEAFEEGMRLAGYCSDELEAAEERVSLLVQKADGKYVETPFKVDEEKDDESSGI